MTTTAGDFDLDAVVARARSRTRVLAAKAAADSEGMETRYSAKVAALDLMAKAFRCGDETVIRVIPPSLERVRRADVSIVDLEGNEGKGLVKAVRAKGLGYRLRRLGLDDGQMQAAMRFAHDFEKARIGHLTANWNAALVGGGKMEAEPERWCVAIDLLSKACGSLSHDEAVAALGYLAFDVSCADIGHFVAGAVSPDEKMHKFTGKLFLVKALNRLQVFYDDWDYRQDEALNRRKIA